MKDIRKNSVVEVKTNKAGVIVLQWGIADKRTNEVIRAARTRQSARNFAKRSKFLTVVSRYILVDKWSKESGYVASNRS